MSGMIGWFYLELDMSNQVVRNGYVIDKLDDGIFLVQIYAGTESRACTVRADKMDNWLFFETRDLCQNFLNAHQQPEAPTPAEAVAETQEPDAVPKAPALDAEVSPSPTGDEESADVEEGDAADFDCKQCGTAYSAFVDSHKRGKCPGCGKSNKPAA